MSIELQLGLITITVVSEAAPTFQKWSGHCKYKITHTCVWRGTGRLRSKTTASSGMCHTASSCTSYTHCVFSNTWVPIQSGWAVLGKRAGMIARDAYKQGKASCMDTWPNRRLAVPDEES